MTSDAFKILLIILQRALLLLHLIHSWLLQFSSTECFFYSKLAYTSYSKCRRSWCRQKLLNSITFPLFLNHFIGSKLITVFNTKFYPQHIKLFSLVIFLYLLDLVVWQNKFSLICLNFEGTLNQFHFTLLFFFTSFRTVLYFSFVISLFLWSMLAYMLACWDVTGFLGAHMACVSDVCPFLKFIKICL